MLGLFQAVEPTSQGYISYVFSKEIHTGRSLLLVMAHVTGESGLIGSNGHKCESFMTGEYDFVPFTGVLETDRACKEFPFDVRDLSVSFTSLCKEFRSRLVPFQCKEGAATKLLDLVRLTCIRYSCAHFSQYVPRSLGQFGLASRAGSWHG